MHELSVAKNIIEMIGEYLSEKELSLVKSIKVRVGKFSNIMPESLIFSYEALTGNTPLQKSKMIIEEVPIEIRCNSCATNTIIDEFLPICPECGGTDITIMSGKELKFEEIELFDNNPESK